MRNIIPAATPVGSFAQKEDKNLPSTAPSVQANISRKLPVVSPAPATPPSVQILGAHAIARETWAHKIGGVETLGLTKEEIKRQELIYEIFLTERDYVDDLKLIVDVFIAELKAKALLKPKEISAIFSNIEQLLPIHEELFSCLEARQREATVIKEIGDIFLKRADFLKMYTLYCANHQSALMRLQANSQNKEFKRFLQKAIMLPQSKRQPLSSYLLKPVQRICRYPMLFKVQFHLIILCNAYLLAYLRF